MRNFAKLALVTAMLLLTAAVPAYADMVYLNIKDECSLPVKIWVNYMNDDGGWTTDGPWNIAANRGIMAVGSDENDIQVDNTSGVYIYAVSQDAGHRATWKGDDPEQIGGRTYYFMQADLGTNDDGDGLIELTCSSHDGDNGYHSN